MLAVSLNGDLKKIEQMEHISMVISVNYQVPEFVFVSVSSLRSVVEIRVWYISRQLQRRCVLESMPILQLRIISG